MARATPERTDVRPLPEVRANSAEKVWQLAACTRSISHRLFTAAAPRWGRRWCLPWPSVCDPARVRWGNTLRQPAARPPGATAESLIDAPKIQPSGSGSNVSRSPALAVPEPTVHDARSKNLSHVIHASITAIKATAYNRPTTMPAPL